MNSMLIVILVTLAWSVNRGYGADIVDPGNMFDRYNPIRSIVGAQPYDNTKLNLFTLPSRMIQGMSNIALAPWRGNDFSGRGGKMPNLSNLFSGLPIIGSSYGGQGTGSTNSYGPMAQVEMARAPGSVLASASTNLPMSSNFGSAASLPTFPNNFFASLPMPSAPGQGSRAQSSSSTNSNQSSRPLSSPTTVSASSLSAGLPSIPSAGSSTMAGTASGSASQLPSVPIGASGQASASASASSDSSSPSYGLGQASNFLSNLFSFPLNG